MVMNEEANQVRNDSTVGADRNYIHKVIEICRQKGIYFIKDSSLKNGGIAFNSKHGIVIVGEHIGGTAFDIFAMAIIILDLCSLAQKKLERK